MSDSKKRVFSIAAAIGLTSLVLRVVIVLLHESGGIAGGDPAAFWSFAQSLARGSGYTSVLEAWRADRPPLYPMFLAGIIVVFGESRSIVFCIQAVLGAASAVLFFLIARRLLGTARGTLAGLMFAALPHFLLFTKQILTEAIYLPELVLFLALTVLPRKMTFRWWLLVGLVIGCAELTRRESALVLIVTVAAFLYLRSTTWRDVARNTVIVLTSAVVVLVPWLVNNYLVFGEPVLYSSGGWNFLQGSNPAATGGYAVPAPEYMAQLQGLGEIEFNRKALVLGLSWVQAHPDEAIGLIPKKLQHLMSWSNNPIIDASDVLVSGMLVAALAKLVRTSRRGLVTWRERWLVLGIALPVVLSTVVMAVLFVGGWRYRLALYPAALLLASYGMPSRRALMNVSLRALSWPFALVYGAEGLNVPLMVLPTRGISELLNAYGARVGDRVRLRSPLTIHNADRDRRLAYSNLSVSDGCYLGRGLFLDLQDRVIIENNVTISHRVTILTHTDVGESPLRDRGFPPSQAPVILRQGAYIGAGVIILPGVEIGECAVVGAGAVVTRNVPAWTVVAGVPARTLRVLSEREPFISAEASSHVDR